MHIDIKIASSEDAENISLYDRHIAPTTLYSKIKQQEVYAAYAGESFAGWLRYGLFWDNTPFMNMLFLLPEYRSKGIGKMLVQFWEEQMKGGGYKVLLTSTQQNETAQHFYLHMGYRAIGGFTLPGDTFEIILSKDIVG